jgi:hypothetical protein
MKFPFQCGCFAGWLQMVIKCVCASDAIVFSIITEVCSSNAIILQNNYKWLCEQLGEQLAAVGQWSD